MTRRRRDREIGDRAALEGLLAQGADLRNYVFHGIDLTGLQGWHRARLADAIFLGCRFEGRDQIRAVERRGAYVFPEIPGLPFDPYRTSLYSTEELMAGYDGDRYPGTRDFRIFTWFDRARRGGQGLIDALAERIHDHAIDDALADLLAERSGRGVVGIMGGHSTRRSDPWFRAAVEAAWRLARRGYLVASGGGPGVMEAANLGAWLKPYADPAVIDAVLAPLAEADRFDGGEPEGTPAYLDAIDRYIATARGVVERFGPGGDPAVAARFQKESDAPGESLAIPTWFYGHEPSNLFSTWVAKYFSNSIREDGLLAIARAGVIYAPGSAGTLQEVFMDLTQNHYATFVYRSPMVFLSGETFSDVYALLRRFVADKGMEPVYGDLLTLTESPADAVAFIDAHPARPREEKTPLYELLGR